MHQSRSVEDWINCWSLYISSPCFTTSVVNFHSGRLSSCSISAHFLPVSPAVLTFPQASTLHTYSPIPFVQLSQSLYFSVFSDICNASGSLSFLSYTNVYLLHHMHLMTES